uniref:Putative chaperone protein DNAj n=2 Tax=Schistosoma mansoni TaxID=6183 RepID=A0A3Q0KQW6_SCHMA
MFLATSNKTRKLTHTFRWVYKYFSTLKEFRDYYEVLNVKSTASPEEIKAAYLDLSKKYHPDKCLDDKAKKHFAEVSEAYSVLGRSESRREYDLNRKVNAFGISADAFRMHYPHPPPDLDKVGLEAYENEMRRRWLEKMTQWAKAQGQYELERGRAMKPITGVYQFVHPITGYTHTNSFLFIMTFLAGVVLCVKSLS